MNNWQRLKWFMIGLVIAMFAVASVVHAKVICLDCEVKNENLDGYYERLARKRIAIDSEIGRRHSKELAELEIERVYLLEKASASTLFVSARGFGGSTESTNTNTSTGGSIGNVTSRS